MYIIGKHGSLDDGEVVNALIYKVFFPDGTCLTCPGSMSGLDFLGSHFYTISGSTTKFQDAGNACSAMELKLSSFRTSPEPDKIAEYAGKSRT